MRGKIKGLGVKNIRLAACPSQSCGAESKPKVVSKTNDGAMFDTAAHVWLERSIPRMSAARERLCQTNLIPSQCIKQEYQSTVFMSRIFSGNMQKCIMPADSSHLHSPLFSELLVLFNLALLLY